MAATLNQIRKNSSYTLAQIAEHMGVGVRIIALWENGERTISAYNLHKLMAFYQAEVTISEIYQLIPNLGQTKQ